MKRWVGVAAALLVLTAGACSDDDGDDAAAPTTTAPAPTSTTDEATTTTAAPVDADRCDTSPVEPEGSLISGVQLDAEGDEEGPGDAAFTFLDDDGWHLRVDLDADRGSADELLTTVPTDAASVGAARDLDGDDDDELFVIVGNGASAQIYGVYDLDGCDLEPVQLPDGTPAELPVGGSVVELHGLRCDADGLTVLTATSDDGVNYTTEERTYSVAAGVLTEVRLTAGDDLTTASPEFPEYSRFAC